MASWKASSVQAANRLLRRFDAEIVRRSDLWKWTSQLGTLPESPGISPVHPDGPFLRVFNGRLSPPCQRSFDFSVIMSTTLRPTIEDALRSIFRQNFGGSVQTLIGLDWTTAHTDIVEKCCLEIPENHSVFFFYPGYSTSTRHGGLNPAWDGGIMRTLLCYLANSRRVAFLDDDNWWDESHLSSMHSALEGHDWAYARRWFVHPVSRRPICEDIWESIGPGAGVYKHMGGWVDPNCLAFDKLACEAVLRWWSIPTRMSQGAMDGDRNVFGILSGEFSGAPTGQATVFYALNEQDSEHPGRLERIGRQQYERSKITTSLEGSR